MFGFPSWQEATSVSVSVSEKFSHRTSLDALCVPGPAGGGGAEGCGVVTEEKEENTTPTEGGGGRRTKDPVGPWRASSWDPGFNDFNGTVFIKGGSEETTRRDTGRWGWEGPWI